MTDERWNHNIHYQGLLLAAIPPGARSALDVGTGDGLLAAALHRMLPEVTAIDVDQDVLDRARTEDPGVTWLRGDVLTHPFGRTFDVVASVATLHHLGDLDAALDRLASLTAPGGLLGIVGLARSTRPADWLWNAAGVVRHRRELLRHTVWVHTAPTVWPPPHSFAEVRRAAARVLPGARYRRLAMFRYLLLWDKPEGAPEANGR